jgi:hypothetical protein
MSFIIIIHIIQPLPLGIVKKPEVNKLVVEVPLTDGRLAQGRCSQCCPLGKKHFNNYFKTNLLKYLSYMA